MAVNVAVEPVHIEMPPAGVIVIVGKEFTVMVPFAIILPQPPDNGISYVYGPDTEGVPLIVMMLLDQLAVTPGGKPIAEPIPVAPVVVCVIAGIDSPKQIDGVELPILTVFSGIIVIVPVTLSKAQPVGFTV